MLDETLDAGAAGRATTFESQTYAKVTWRILPFLLICYLVAYLDRVNVGFAKLQMSADLLELATHASDVRAHMEKMMALNANRPRQAILAAQEAEKTASSV